MSVVTLSEEWPRWRESQVIWAPFSSARLAKVWRKLWKVRFSWVGRQLTPFGRHVVLTVHAACSRASCSAGGVVIEAGLVAFAVVEDLDVVEQGGSELRPVGPDAVAVEVKQLAFERRPERFHGGVVGWGADAAKESRTFSSWALSQNTSEVYWLPWSA